MKVSRRHFHQGASGEYVEIDIDTDGEPHDGHVRHHQRALWHAIREEAHATLDAGLVALYASAPGRVHRCETMDAFAAVTRRERAAAGVVWREDRL
jgi:hypothetical protein